MSNNVLSPEALAAACSTVLDADDACAHAHGIEVKHTNPGMATLTMTVRDTMLNGHGMCQGGMIFTLADTAFAHACNSYNRNTVASGCSIDFLAPGKLNDTLTACAEERSRSGRTGVYDVSVTNQSGELIALFRGKSYQIKGNLVDEKGNPA